MSLVALGTFQTNKKNWPEAPHALARSAARRAVEMRSRHDCHSAQVRGDGIVSEQQFLQQFLQVFTEIRDELSLIADELGDLNANMTTIEEMER